MKVYPPTLPSRVHKSASGFTLAETLVATLAVAVMLLALYASFTFGFATMRMTREDLRATQIIIQKMEAIRLSPYDLVANPAAYPTNSTAYFDESTTTTNHGAVYTVSFRATPKPPGMPNTPSSIGYGSNMMLVTVTASWVSGNSTNLHSRSMQTYVARTGIQNYVAGN